MTQAPAGQSADQEQHRERDNQEYDRSRGGTGEVVGFDLLEDEDGGRLGLERDRPGDQDGGAELADGPGEREGRSRENRRGEVGQDDPAKGRERAGTEGSRGLLHVAVQLEQ